ncbi:MAG: hypothetical protein UDP13_02315, partial [Butyricicoccus sp.]|nr:hypothetical protein [Butyricicoccus sp.]
GVQFAPASWLSLWESWHLRSKWLRGRISNEFVSGKPEKESSRYKPSLSLRDISPRGRDKFCLCVR